MSGLFVRRSAVIESDYRYELRIIWNDALPILVVCMLNPSTADAEFDDPTTLALRYFAGLWDYGGILIVNLYAFRASQPSVMVKAADPRGPRNDGVIDDAIHYASGHGGRVLVAWGNGGAVNAQAMSQRVAAFVRSCAIWKVETVCLGVTLSGAPKHPMARGQHRIPRYQVPVAWKSPHPEGCAG